MRKIFKWFFKIFIFWTIVFQFGRLVFALYELPQTSALDFTIILQAFSHGVRQDFSASGYITMLNGIFLMLFLMLGVRKNRVFFRVLNLILMIIVASIVSIDCELYRNWGLHMDATPLLYLQTPKEAMASTTPLQMSFTLLITLLIVLASNWLYGRLFQSNLWYEGKKKLYRYAAINSVLLLSALMIIPIRGGFGIAPMNSGTVYFSKDLYPNHLAVNSSWNFLYSVTKMDDFASPYRFMDNTEANNIREKIFHKSPIVSPMKESGEKPNVLVVLMESFSGKLVGALGYKDYTPNLTKIANNNILFTNIYSTGDRSDRGIVGVISGYPSEPTASIMKYPQKSQQLPFVTKALEAYGYKTTYYYGGDTDFANMHSYLVNADFDKVVDMSYFDPKDYNSKWGVHDGVMLDFLLNDINKDVAASDTPFFKMVFTLSSHEPFEVPMETVIKGDSEQDKFLNSVTYTDRCLGRFYNEAKKQPWFKNTLIVFVADHGHRLPYDSNANDPEKYHIPMILAGGVVQKDTVVVKSGSNTDVPATILGQLGVSSEAFLYSKDLMDPNSSSFGYFVYGGGIGASIDSTKIVYDLNSNDVVYKDNFSENGLHEMKAVLQSAWNTFLGNTK
ncbi:LTA synthase family protein [Halosquirtibacter xylanolyticus]|uniref:LTA synthase family protein n=1 Tax=Halosquirtibacter xylanolyticus TaxID=3374599 RepID=UPI0037499813|nr:LTA synthase family protein [Prolixibacteraceae bacterium]